MSSRPQFSPYKVITDGDMSSNLTSQVTIVQKLSLISYAISWAGTSPVGAISVEVSNDYKLDASGTVLNAGTWNELPLSNPTNITGDTGKGFIDIDSIAGYAVRLVYTFSSGVGILQATVSGKVA